MEDLIKDFSIDHLNPSPRRSILRSSIILMASIFEHYRLKISLTELSRSSRQKYHPDDETLLKITPIIQERIVTLDDAPEIAGFFLKIMSLPDRRFN